METRRICPKCMKQYPGNEAVCEECGERLNDISTDFEEAFSMVGEPVLLSNGHDIDISYLKEELRKHAVPYYVEEGQNVVPANHIKEGMMEVRWFKNFYVDKSRWKSAKEALVSTKERSKDRETPVVKVGQIRETAHEESRVEEAGDGRSLWARLMDQEMYVRLGLVLVVILFVLGVVRIIMS